MKMIMVLIMIVGLSGCTYTMNEQRASCRCAADVGLTVTASKTDMTELQLKEIELIAIELQEFIENGNIKTLTGGELQSFLSSKIPAKYRIYFNQLIILVPDYAVVIPEDVAKRMDAILFGVKTACTKYEF